MGSCGGGVAVVVKSTEVVAAVLPVADSWLAMSNLDLLLPPLDVGIFLCYNYDMSGSNNEKMIGMVKKGLAEVLVSFYPLAGEVVINKEGEPEVHCNNRGVDFAQAFADIDLQHLDLYNPDVSIDASFVPIKKHGVLSVQVTRMKCGGLVIGCSFDHRVADAHSINKFLVAWADATTSNYSRNDKNLNSNNNNNNNNIPTLFTPGNYKYMKNDHNNNNTNTPCYRRSLLNPRRPGHHDAAIEDMYILIKAAAAAAAAKNSSQKPQQQLLSPPSFQLESRIYQISASQIQNLQSEAGPERSKFESFSALLWQLLAKAGKEDKKTCKLGIVVDGRKCLTRSSSSLNNNNNSNKISSMENYFGNVLSVPYIEASVGELKSLSLSKTAKLVHQCVESAANEEHFRGLVDWVEDQRPNQAMSKIYSSVPGETDEVAVVVSSGQRFPISQFDFGWGLPCFGSYHFPWGGYTGYVMPMPSVANNGDWIVYMHLFPKHLLFIEKEAPHIFRPFIF